ncbi:MAG: glycosyltransferase [candidate division KSB1 bacterium]|nr:glycosyltransferase [candidate division KSB1 bacterium]
MAKVSVIIAFYNEIEFLRLVLAGYVRQSFRDFEIIVADDGSRTEVTAEIQSLIKSSAFPIHHIWQEKLGFRKNRILNKAVLASSADYLIFTDGDCVPHREFVREHYMNRSPGACLVGRRVNLSERMTRQLTAEKIAMGVLEKKYLNMLLDSILRRMNYVEKGIYIKSPFLRKIMNRKKRDLLGSNFSIHKVDILSVNGFDERYEEPGIGEDGDLQIRLERNDIAFKSVNFVAIQYHLYHHKREVGERNFELLEQVKNSRVSYTPFGIHQSTAI